MQVSVIVPTFRRPGLVKEAVQSALSQEGVSLEVLVVDDAPEGSAQAAIEAIGDPRVRYVRSARPSGGRPAVVRNEGFHKTTGAFVHFLDDDDVVAPGAYAALTSALERSGAGVAFGRVEPFGDDAAEVARQQRYFDDAARRARRAARLHSRHWMVTNMLFRPTVLVNSACLIRRECAARLGGYDEALPIVEDVDFFLRAIRAFGFAFVDRPVLRYRTGAPSLMNADREGRRTREAYRRIHDAYREAHGRAEHLALKLLARTALRWL